MTLPWELGLLRTFKALTSTRPLRIAVWCAHSNFTGTCSVTNGAGYEAGEAGTIYWRLLPPPGALFYIR